MALMLVVAASLAVAGSMALSLKEEADGEVKGDQ
jgi:hypothetical protein